MRAHALAVALCLAVQACALENPLTLPNGADVSAFDDASTVDLPAVDVPLEDRGVAPTDAAVDRPTPDAPVVDVPPRDDVPDRDDVPSPLDIPVVDVPVFDSGDGRDSTVPPDVPVMDVPVVDTPPPDVTDGRDVSTPPDLPVMDVPVVDVPVVDVPTVDRIDPVDVGPPPSPETCSTAALIPEVVGTQTINGTTRGFRADYNGSCGRRTTGNTNRPDAVYAIELTERRRVQLSVRGRGTNLDTVMYVSRDCATVSSGDLRVERQVACNDDASSSERGSAVDVELQPGRWYVFVDGYENSTAPGYNTSGDFALTVTLSAPLGPPPMTITRGAGACPEAPAGFPSGEYRVHVITDDRTTGTVSIPFTFQLLGRSFTSFAMADNGYLQLLTSGVSVESEATNAVIPLRSNPDSLVAPFWDDLYPVISTRHVSWVTGSSPNRVLNVRWENTARYRDMGARLTFGVELRETANTVTFRYCSLVGSDGPNARGGSATVGVESHDGATGALVHLNEPNALSDGTSITLSP